MVAHAQSPNKIPTMHNCNNKAPVILILISILYYSASPSLSTLVELEEVGSGAEAIHEQSPSKIPTIHNCSSKTLIIFILGPPFYLLQLEPDTYKVTIFIHDYQPQWKHCRNRERPILIARTAQGGIRLNLMLNRRNGPSPRRPRHRGQPG